MSNLALHISEIQRVATQLEDALGEVDAYSPQQRAAAAGALTDLAIRLELARLVVLDPGGDRQVEGA